MFLLIVCLVILSVDGRVVVTTSGPVRGKLVNDNGIYFYAYEGIPYAESPIGPLRFKPPVPKKPWTEILETSTPGPVCPQPEGSYTRDQMSEDCLTINVFVPANFTAPSPAYVNVHGGAFKSNAGNIDIMNGPQFLLDRGIICVSMNFRLGALGYLSLETEEASGNAGLKDLLLALEWIKDNIERFGGDTITVGGQSSGAAMVHHMLLTSKSTGLFHRAMMNSGSATSPRFLSRYPKKYALALADQLGFDTTLGNGDILQNLRKSDVFDIIHAQESIYINRRNIMRAFAPFVPTIEKEFPHSILTEHPTDIIKRGIPQNVPILSGINSIEGAYMWPKLHNLPVKYLQEQFVQCIQSDIEYPTNSSNYKNLVASISELYFNNWTMTNFYGLLSDTQYTYYVHSWISEHKNQLKSNNVFFYLFDFDGALNWSKLNYNISFPGAVHSDEIGYLFVNKVTRNKLNDLDIKSRKTLDYIVTLISHFIKYGNPSKVGYNIEWLERGNNGNYLVLNDQPAMQSQSPFTSRFDFWTDVYKRYDQYIASGGQTEPNYFL